MLYIITFVNILKIYATNNNTYKFKNTAISSQTPFWKSIKTELS